MMANCAALTRKGYVEMLLRTLADLKKCHDTETFLIYLNQVLMTKTSRERIGAAQILVAQPIKSVICVQELLLIEEWRSPKSVKYMQTMLVSQSYEDQEQNSQCA